MPARGSFTITGAQLFDGRRMVDGSTVIVADGRIAAVITGIAPSTGLDVVDATGMTLLPGLIDCHAHVFPGDLERAPILGVTTELDMFADPLVVAELRARMETDSGLADVRSAGWGATAPGGHPSDLVEMGYYRPFPTLADPDEAARFVADRLAEGSDYIKVIIDDGSATGFPSPTLSSASVGAVVEAAHRQDRLAIAHVTAKAAAELAVSSGADVLAHLFIDRPADAALIEAIAAGGLAVIPTLVMLETLCGRPSGAVLLADPLISPYLDARQEASLASTYPAPPGSANRAPTFEVALGSVGALRSAGVTILAGSDASNPGTAHGASLHRELGLLVQAGLTPIEALTAATAAPARLFGLSDRGRIETGLLADLVLVRGDPTVDISATRDITRVWRGGQPVDRPSSARQTPRS